MLDHEQLTPALGDTFAVAVAHIPSVVVGQPPGAGIVQLAQLCAFD